MEETKEQNCVNKRKKLGWVDKLIGIGRAHPISIASGGAGVIVAMTGIATKRPKHIKQFLTIMKKTATVVGVTYVGTKCAKTTLEAVKHITDTKADGAEYARRCKADGDLYAQKLKADGDFLERKYELQAKYGKIKAIDEGEPIIGNETSSSCEVKSNITWDEKFKSEHKIPPLPPIAEEVVSGCSEKIDIPLIIALFCMFGTYCFSKVRGRFLDGQLHAPNMQVAIEGNSGVGKEIFNTIRKLLFGRIIASDAQKMNEDAEAEAQGLTPKHHIIQTADVGISDTKLPEMMANNEGVHCFIFDQEVLSLINAMKKPGGLTYDHLRKAFDNGNVGVFNKSRNSKNGIFPVYLNYCVTGTPGDIKSFVCKQIEGGTTSRICWPFVPDNSNDQVPILPKDKKLEQILDQIDEWREKFCFTTDADGNDHAVNEVEVNLEYLNRELDRWIYRQECKAEKEHNPARKDLCRRFSNIGFVFGMVAHMMWYEPTEEQTTIRKAVTDLAILLADYCFERWLHKFGKSHNVHKSINQQAEFVSAESPADTTSSSNDDIESLVVKLYNDPQLDERGNHHWGYGRIARHLGWLKPNGRPDDDKVRAILRKHKVIK